MKSIHGAPKLKLYLVAALGVLAVLALPAVASAKARDRNHDHIPDRWEKRHHLSLHVNQAHRNQDHEGLNNLEEFENGTNPHNPDTDGDGLTDAQEVEVGDDPTNPDSNSNGVEDGQENAGTIAAFDGTTLTIDLFGGSTLSGQVNESTEIECDNGGGGSNGDASSSDVGGGDQSGEDQSEEVEVEEAGCSIANLVPGAPVQEAELDATSGGVVFHSVHLAG